MKTESDTPRTDAETMRDEYDHVDTEFGPYTPSDTVSADFARQLERELNAAMQAIRDVYHNEYNSRETYTIFEKILPKEEHIQL